MAQIVKGDWMRLDAPIKRKAKPAAAATHYQIKVTLKGSKPSIWRRLLVRSDTTLALLHDVLQVAMGWDDCHLHAFEVGDVSYSSTVPDMGIDGAEDEARVTLQKVAPKLKMKFKYEYDMGDGWAHEIVVEKILTAEVAQKVPICLAGAGACPPEDCGGLWGYYAMLDTLEDPKHPDYEEMIERVPEDFDPNLFELDAVNKSLKKLQKK